MLQRSWTIEQGDEDDLPGAVYVGRASFRMVGTPAPVKVTEERLVDTGIEPPVAEVTRIPTERIVLVRGQMSEPPVVVPTARRRPLSLIFGAAFAVGVACTLVGQVVLPSREGKSRMAALTVPGTSGSPDIARAAAADTPARRLEVDPTAPPAPAGADESDESDRSAKLDSALGGYVASAAGDEHRATSVPARKIKTRSSRRVAKQPGTGTVTGTGTETAVEGDPAAGHEKGVRTPARWVDPFAEEGDAAPSAEAAASIAAHSNRKTQAHEWVDPFAE